jgi:hypothetical protein
MTFSITTSGFTRDSVKSDTCLIFHRKLLSRYEDWGSMFFCNTAYHPPHYAVLHLRKLHAAILPKECQITKCENISFKPFHLFTINHALWNQRDFDMNWKSVVDFLKYVSFGSDKLYICNYNAKILVFLSYFKTTK